MDMKETITTPSGKEISWEGEAWLDIVVNHGENGWTLYHHCFKLVEAVFSRGGRALVRFFVASGGKPNRFKYLPFEHWSDPEIPCDSMEEALELAERRLKLESFV